MLANFLQNKLLQLVLSGLIIGGTLVCIFTPENMWFKSTANYAMQIMLAYVGIGVLFLILKQEKLMLTTFICAAAIAFFLKNTFGNSLERPTITESPIIKAAHLNTSDFTGEIDSIIHSITLMDADVVSFQELTPDWNSILSEKLSEKYPHSKSVVRIDPFGLAVFSKFPFKYIDTFHFENIPNLVGCIKKKGVEKPFHFVSSHIHPPISSTAYDKLKSHLDRIADKVRFIDEPLLALGDFNAVAWSNEIQAFRQETNLKDSRRGGMPPLLGTGFSFFENSMDYIFHSDQLKCVNFESIYNTTSEQLGIFGTYQVDGSDGS